MPLSDFYSARPDRLPFGSRQVECRPLTLQQTLQLWDSISGPDRVFLAETFAGKHPASERLTAIFRAFFAVLFPGEDDDGTEAQWAGLFRWYLDAHKWERILSEVFGIGENADDSGEESDLVDLLFVIERSGGRKIEEMLSMRVEAFLTYRDSFANDLKRRRDAASQRVDGNSSVTHPADWDEMYSVTPMDEVEPLEVDN